MDGDRSGCIPNDIITLTSRAKGKLDDVDGLDGCTPMTGISRAEGKLDDVDDRDGSLWRDAVLVRIVHELHVRLPSVPLERLSLS